MVKSDAVATRVAAGVWLLFVGAGCDCGGRMVQPDAGSDPADATQAEDSGGGTADSATRIDAALRDSGGGGEDAGAEDVAVGPQIRVDDAADQQSVPKVAALPGGSAWISYFSREQDEYRVRLQRLDADGARLLGERGLLISDKDSDSFTMDQQLLATEAGDAVLVFQDIRLGHYEVFAYRFGLDAQPHWGAEGVRLFEGDDEEIAIDALLLDGGDLVVAAERVTASGSLVALQRVTPAGALRWGGNGVQIDASAAGRTCTRPRLARANGSAVDLAWMDTPNLMSTQRKVLVRQLDADGAPVWTADAQLSTALDIPMQFPLQLEADGEGGLWVAWTVVEAALFHVMLQHLDAAGDPKLGLGGPTEGIPVSTSTTSSQLYPVLAQDAMVGELVVFWQELNPAQDRYGISGQSFGRQNGARRFADTGAVIVDASELRTTPGAARAPGGAGIVFFDRATPMGEVSNFFAGAMELAAEPAARTIPLTDTAGSKSFGFVSREGVDATWLVWMDGTLDDGDILATRATMP